MSDPIRAINAKLDAEGYQLKNQQGDSIPEFYATRATRKLAMTATLAAELGVALQHQPVISIQAPSRPAVAQVAPKRPNSLSRWARVTARRSKRTRR